MSQVADAAVVRELFERAQLAQTEQNWGLAALLYARAETLAPEEFRLPNNRANCHWLADQPQEARQAYRRSILLESSDHRPWRGLGNTLRDLNRFEAADRAFAMARQLEPSAETAWNHSQVLIGLELYRQAWALSEQRLDVPQFTYYRAGPYWQGWGDQPPAPLTIWSEQGFGDTFQFLRWLLLLAHHEVRLEVEPPLVPLLQEGLSWLARPPEVVAKQSTPPAARCHGSLMSLPSRLGGGTLTAQAFASGPYLRIAKPRGLMGRRIGVVWAAGRKLVDPFTAREYRKRSLPAEVLERLLRNLRHLGFGAVNLQVGPDRDDLDPTLAELFAEALPARADFLEAGRLIQGLDAVITVDTAMAHQAGAQGIPAWVLLPWSADPRWLRSRSDSPWYPSLHLLRQGEDRSWWPVIQLLQEQLRTIPPTDQG